MVIRNYRLVIFLMASLAISCKSVQHISKTNVNYEIISSRTAVASDTSITQMIAPYKVQLDEEMNEVIGTVAKDLTKNKPESTLGNWYTDAMMAAAKKEGLQADLAISNYGGLRVPYITAGPLTVGEIYELCPFDNLLVIVDVPGNVLDSLFQLIAASEGWPISSSVWMVITDKRMTQCTINGSPIDPLEVYKIAMPDYVANGGDNASCLIPLSRLQTGLLIRDILIGYAKDATNSGKEITALIQGRIVIKSN